MVDARLRHVTRQRWRRQRRNRQGHETAIADFTDPATLKDRTDGEIFYIIKNGHKDMPPEGQRVKTEQNWGLVNYVRSLAKKKSDAEQKPQ
jgi:mono/diheme cytochrome c family protein